MVLRSPEDGDPATLIGPDTKLLGASPLFNTMLTWVPGLINALLVESIKEQQRQIESIKEQQKQIAEQQAELQSLKEQLKQMNALKVRLERLEEMSRVEQRSAQLTPIKN